MLVIESINVPSSFEQGEKMYENNLQVSASLEVVQYNKSLRKEKVGMVPPAKSDIVN